MLVELKDLTILK